MAWIGTLATPIFKQEDPTIPVGLIGYFRVGSGGVPIRSYGTPLGLLLVLTQSSRVLAASRFLKVIQTETGFREITF